MLVHNFTGMVKKMFLVNFVRLKFIKKIIYVM